MQTDVTITNSVGEGNPENIKVLVYHRVLDDARVCDEQKSMCVHTDTFRNQLQHLERWGFTTITFHDYRLYLNGELRLPRKPVILTFDDGYLDVHQYAFPLLREFGMKAVVFAIGNSQIQSNVWDQDKGIASAPLMNPRQIVELHEAGFEIGSHTLSHAILPSLSKEEASEEIARSRMLLEILLNAPVQSFAYPYGLATEPIKRMVFDAGYTTGCGVYTGPAQFGVDPFDIRRILVFNTTDTFDFGLRMLVPYEHYAWLKWKIRMLLSSSKRRNSDFYRMAMREFESLLYSEKTS